MFINFKKALVSILAMFFLFVIADNAQAGFGISPPYVKSDKLVPGTHFEQVITLLRSSAEDDLQAEVVLNAPDISNWITIDPGTSFELPKDNLQVPMTVKIDVPADAPLGPYQGYINIRIVPKNKGGSGVAIALGARVDIDLKVTNEEIPEYNIRTVAVPDFEVLGTPWKWWPFSYFFYRTNVVLKIENTGNVKVAPTRVHLEVYDLTQRKLLEKADDTSIKKIDPYQTQDTKASFPTKLSVGQYWGKIKVYKDNDVVSANEIAFTIYEHGQMPGEAPKLSPWAWAMLAGILIVFAVIILVLAKLKAWRVLFKLIYLISLPLVFVWRIISGGFNKLKKKFWRYMHQKASNYQNKNEDDD